MYDNKLEFLTNALFYHPLRHLEMLRAIEGTAEDSQPFLIPTDCLPYSEVLYVNHNGITIRYRMDDINYECIGFSEEFE